MRSLNCSLKKHRTNRRTNGRTNRRIYQMMNKSLLFILLIIISLLLPACQRKEQEEKELMVGAAASLKNVMERLKDSYEEKEGISLVFTYASSGTLEQQIRQGAPIDIFLSASDSQIKSLSADQYLLENTITELLENQVVLIVPSDSTLNLTGFEDIPRALKIAIGDPASVPAGKYAIEVFEYYGLLDEVEKAAVYGKDVTEVLTWVSSGNADAGVVYSTEAVLSDQVTVVAAAPEGSHSRVVYPGAVVKGTKLEEAAKDFLEYLGSEEAKKVFEEYGFLPVD